MEGSTPDYPRKLLLWGAPIVGGHFLAVVWHLILVVKVEPNFPRPAIPLLILVNLLPIVGLVALAKGLLKVAGILIVVPLGIALVIGAYQHFLSPGTDNVFHLPPGDLTLPFQASACFSPFWKCLAVGPGSQPLRTEKHLMSPNVDTNWTNRTAKAILLVRVLVGWVFLSEGIQKFLFPDSLGAGRFVKIGIPWPQAMAPFVGVVEIVCGMLLLIGLITRLAAIPLVIDICVALYSTKIVTLAKNGVWGTLHEARTDVSMLFGLIFLLLVGGGTLSLDAHFVRKRQAEIMSEQ